MKNKNMKKVRDIKIKKSFLYMDDISKNTLINFFYGFIVFNLTLLFFNHFIAIIAVITVFSIKEISDITEEDEEFLISDFLISVLPGIIQTSLFYLKGF